MPAPLPTPINGFPEFDELSPNMPPISFHALYQVLDSRVNARFASTTERDTAITAPVNGMECWTDDAGKWIRRGGVWQAVSTGVVAYGIATGAAGSITTTSSTSVRINYTGLGPSGYLMAGNAYRFLSNLRVASTVAGDSIQLQGRITPSGNAPANTDGVVAANSTVVDSAGASNLYPIDLGGTFQVGTSGIYVFSLWGSRGFASGTVSFWGDPRASAVLTIEVHHLGVALPSIPVF